MKITAEELIVNGVTYVPKSQAQAAAPAVDGLPLVVIRAARSGVHYGYLKSRTGQEVELVNARRVWYWAGACSLSQLAKDGTAQPKECRITVPVAAITVLEVIEIIPVTSEAQKSIDGVSVWKQ